MITQIVSHLHCADLLHFPLPHDERFIESEGDSKILVYFNSLFCRVLLSRVNYQGVTEIAYRYVAVIVDLGILIVLNYDNFSYSEKLYDSFVSPFYQGHRETIQKYTD